MTIGRTVSGLIQKALEKGVSHGILADFQFGYAYFSRPMVILAVPFHDAMDHTINVFCCGNADHFRVIDLRHKTFSSFGA